MQKQKQKKRETNGKELSPLGEELARIRKMIEADPNIKMLSLEDVRKEVDSRRTGNNWNK